MFDCAALRRFSLTWWVMDEWLGVRSYVLDRSLSIRSGCGTTLDTMASINGIDSIIIRLLMISDAGIVIPS